MNQTQPDGGLKANAILAKTFRWSPQCCLTLVLLPILLACVQACRNSFDLYDSVKSLHSGMTIEDVAAVMPRDAVLRELKVVERAGNWVDGMVLWKSFSDKTPTRCLEYTDSHFDDRMARIYFDADGIIVGWYFSAS